MKIATESDRSRWIAFVQSQPLPVEVDCKRWRKSRTNDQNNLLFGVIYPPQVAIVGFGRIVERPFIAGGRVKKRPVISVSLAADHRASDGHIGGLLLSDIDRLLQEPGKL